jgi:electron transfer flavoprotein beta subunit
MLVSDRKFAGADVLATSYTLSQGVRKMGNVDLIICGKQTTDGDTAQVGPEMAEYLSIPHVANVRKIIELKEKSIVVEMDMPDTIEVAEVNYPCLITVEKGIFQPRLPSYKKKVETKDRQIGMISLKDFEDQNEKRYGLNGSPTQVERIFPPAVNNDREMWTGEPNELKVKLMEKLKSLKFV